MPSVGICFYLVLKGLPNYKDIITKLALPMYLLDT